MWFNYDPRSGTNFLAFTSTSRTTEITISDDAFDRGVWVVAASIIHEFAHLNGAPGQDGSGSRAAEESLKHCGFAAHFNPDAIGIMRVYSELRGTRLA